MNQEERRTYLIAYLLKERNLQTEVVIPTEVDEQKRLLRTLLNLRQPNPMNEDFLVVQDAYLQAELAEKGITDFRDLAEVVEDFYLWQGDITTLKCDAIVNAANAQLLGCFSPNHGCIDNAIHTYSGIQLRLACSEIMQKQGKLERTGQAKITFAYNLPCKYILHTVGPIVRGDLTKEHEMALENCYKSCLNLAEKYQLKSIAFCCISTGEYHFPNERAAQIALHTIKSYKKERKSKIKIILNVFKELDREIYAKLLRAN